MLLRAIGAAAILVISQTAAAQDVDTRQLLRDLRANIAELRRLGMNDPAIIGPFEQAAAELEAEIASEARAAGNAAAAQPAPVVPSVEATYAPKPNILDGQVACAGYTVANYRARFEANSSGREVQRHSLCAAAYAYYGGYLNGIRQGYSQVETDRTYAAFLQSAETASAFYRDYQGGTGF